MLSLRVDRIKPQPVFCSAFDMGSNKEAEGQQKNDGQTPEPMNRSHIAGRIGTDECAAPHKNPMLLDLPTDKN